MNDSCNTGLSLRYSRQIPLIGVEGQAKLQRSRVLCIGAGGLGCPALLSLAAAGVGKLGIIDGDRVSLSNLHRQILFTEKDVGRLKAEAAKERLLEHQADLEVEIHPYFLDAGNAPLLLKKYDLILDGTDNYNSRYLANRVSRKLGIPLISGSVLQFEAQIAIFNQKSGPCYQCLYPAPPPRSLVPNCSDAGIFGALTAITGNLQATEAIKLLVGLKGSLGNQLLTFNLLSMEFRLYPFHSRKGCPLCEGKSIISSDDSLEVIELEAGKLKEWLVEKQELTLIDVRESHERQIDHIGGAHIPLKQLLEISPSWPKNGLIVCYCERGGRSIQATAWLKEQGYSSVFSLKGGMENWKNQMGAG